MPPGVPNRFTAWPAGSPANSPSVAMPSRGSSSAISAPSSRSSSAISALPSTLTGYGARNSRACPGGTIVAVPGAAAWAASRAANSPSAMPAWQAKPPPVTASMIFPARASSPPKYLAGPRAPIAQAPGHSTSTRGQSSPTRDTTRSKARPASGSGGTGHSGHRSTSTRAGPAVVTPCPAFPRPPGPLGPPSHPAQAATATASAAAPRRPGRPPPPAPAGHAAARGRPRSRPIPGG